MCVYDVVMNLIVVCVLCVCGARGGGGGGGDDDDN